MAASNAKLKEALGHIEAAEKSLKTSLFKWSPDFEVAANEYSKAATSFKLAGAADRAKDAYIRAAEMHGKVNGLFHGAKLLTQAAGIAADLGKIDEAVQLMEQACSMYREHGSPESAAATLSRAGKMCELKSPSKAVDMYIKAAELCLTDEKARDASDHLNQAVRMELKQNRFLEAADIMRRRISICLELGQANLCYSIKLGQVIAFLASGNRPGAERAFQEGFAVPDFGTSDEASYAESFIKAFAEGDQELLDSTKKQPTVSHLDTEIARIARSLQLRDDMLDTSYHSDLLPPGVSELEQYENEGADKSNLADSSNKQSAESTSNPPAVSDDDIDIN